MEYDNGEIESVRIVNLEPDDGDFSTPSVGDGVCVKSRGGKYSAKIREITADEV